MISRIEIHTGKLKPFLGFRPWRRHSLVLLVSGFIYMAIGASYFTWVPYGPRWNALIVPLSAMPIQFWAGVFMVAGFLAVVSSRWPKISEKWGYSVLTGLSGGWSASYFAGAFFTINDVANLTGGFLWGLITFLWWAASGLVNPEDVMVVVVDESS